MRKPVILSRCVILLIGGLLGGESGRLRIPERA